MVRDDVVSHSDALEHGYVSKDDVTRGRQDPAFFDADFHHPERRGRLNVHHLELATAYRELLGGRSFAEVGGGRCWLTHLLQVYGQVARGYDISREAVASSPARAGSVHVLNVSEQAVDPPAQVVDCHNVMGYLFDDEIHVGMANLVASFTELLGLCVVTEEGWRAATKVGIANNGRPYLRPRAWWDRLFARHGLVRVPPSEVPFYWQPYLYRKA